ncbi:high-affinity Fe2+/Pb2+ permease [Croceicoccus naphthovorans]|uniref:Uncharacterized protein n=1 Tax=Croceicoccus naphthovorans TaxID=1348774 RepID=A0A0G3XFF7_9SPHN|nr:hypothetical protein AB433_04260 [Croceicoccus naphthovorans]MBB3990302.1 high-affinity Fe2+/Pb2+ permease [Croceicoccus naphthovorans]
MTDISKPRSGRLSPLQALAIVAATVAALVPYGIEAGAPLGIGMVALYALAGAVPFALVALAVGWAGRSVWAGLAVPMVVLGVNLWAALG